MLAVFRADASAALGGGHVMRCLTLARSLEQRGWRCGFAVNAGAGAVVPALSAVDCLELDADGEGAAALHDRWPGGADWLVVDHYGLDAAWERQHRGWASAVLVLDDLAGRPHDCDVLLDQTFGRQPADYAGLVPPGCRLLTGADYALLRPAFAAARDASLARRRGGGGLRRLLVSLGATDPENYTVDALWGIAGSAIPATVDVVLGAGAPHLAAVRDEIARMPQEVQLHIDTDDLHALMTRADLAIGAAGSSTWERCCLGVPSLMMVIAENQRYIAEQVAAAGAARLIAGPRPALAGQIAAALSKLAAAPNSLRDMGSAAAAICDGRGCDRVGLALVPPGRARDGRAVALRLATPDDEDRILAWQRHLTTRRFARNPAVPSAAEHHDWFTRRLADPDCLLTIIMLGGEAVGVLRLDPEAGPADARPAGCREVSILVDPDCRGQGVALEALKFLRRWQRNLVIAAEVLPGNEASAALFRSAGYQRGPQGLLYSYPALSAPPLDP